MLHFNINLTSLAVILWSGMLIIAGSIWVLSSQVHKLSEHLDHHANARALAERRKRERRGLRVRSRTAQGRRAVVAARKQAQAAASREA